jgi:hypothetical protein
MNTVFFLSMVPAEPSALVKITGKTYNITAVGSKSSLTRTHSYLGTSSLHWPFIPQTLPTYSFPPPTFVHLKYFLTSLTFPSPNFLLASSVLTLGGTITSSPTFQLIGVAIPF